MLKSKKTRKLAIFTKLEEELIKLVKQHRIAGMGISTTDKSQGTENPKQGGNSACQFHNQYWVVPLLYRDKHNLSFHH